jgi:hypothetical protein
MALKKPENLSIGGLADCSTNSEKQALVHLRPAATKRSFLAGLFARGR